MLRAPAGRLTPGLYFATVSVGSAGALNTPQEFHVVLDVRQNRPPAEVVADNDSAAFHATPYFWVGQKFHRWTEKGYGGTYLTNGGARRTGRDRTLRAAAARRAL